MNDPGHPVGVGYAYGFGWVAPDVTRLTVRFQGGAATDIPLHEGFFLYSVPPAHWPAGHRPSILEARDARGPGSSTGSSCTRASTASTRAVTRSAATTDRQRA